MSDLMDPMDLKMYIGGLEFEVIYWAYKFEFGC